MKKWPYRRGVLSLGGPFKCRSSCILLSQAKIKILFVAPLPTDPINRPDRENFIDFRGEKKCYSRNFSVPYRKWEKIICSMSIWNTSWITYDFIEGHWGKSISKSNNNDGHHLVCVCRCCRKPERLKKLWLTMH